MGPAKVEVDALVECVGGVVDGPYGVDDVVAGACGHTFGEVVLHGGGGSFAVHGDGEERVGLEVVGGKTFGGGSVPVRARDKVAKVGGGVLCGESPGEGVDIGGLCGGPDLGALTVELRKLGQTG